MVRKILNYTISIIIILSVWITAAKIINAPLILPYPFEVIKIAGKLITTLTFWKAFLHTFLRVVISFVISVTMGTALGVICASSKNLQEIFELPLSIVRSTPVVAIILITLFWFTSKTVPVVVAVLMALPIMTANVTKGFSQADKSLENMAIGFQLSKKQIFKYIKIPSAMPLFLSGCEAIFGLCWKVVVAGEVLSLPKNGCGTLMQQSQVHLETGNVIAVTLIVVLVSYILQKLLGMIKWQK